MKSESKEGRKGLAFGASVIPGQTRKLENQGQSLRLYFLCILLSHPESRDEGLGCL